ncbi:MAG: LLM class F420-dependent oxidoreductase [Myxococcota bacterium]
MKFWQALSFSEPEQYTEIAKAAEAVGFHGVLVSDHLFHPERLESRYPYSPDGKPAFDADTPWPDPFCAVSAMAAVTSRLRFCTMVYILPLRHPLEVAKTAGTAAVLSGGRLILGAGIGWIREEFDTLGREFRTRGRRCDEMIEVLRRLWSGGMVRHRGEFFSFEPLQMSPAPERPVPVYIGGQSEPALRRAATLGDGWLGTGQLPDEIGSCVARLRELRKQAGREGEPFEIIVPLNLPPDLDLFRRLEDEGVDGVVSWPFSYALGPRSTLNQKRGLLEDYAERFIHKLD